jgi:hypothetical protein
MTAPGIVSYDSITKPFTGDVKTIPLHFIKKFCKDFKMEVHPTRISYKDLFFTFKSGPLGNQVVTSISSLKDWSGSQLAASIWLCTSHVGTFLKDFLDMFAGNVSDKLSKRIMKCKGSIVGFTRKLSIVHDSELKERVICIFDYFSQVC